METPHNMYDTWGDMKQHSNWVAIHFREILETTEKNLVAQAV